MRSSLARVRALGVLSLLLLCTGLILTTNGKDAPLALVLQLAGAAGMFLCWLLLKRAA
jgi:hypothetical protein